jgi:site-specific DNA-cytosine methylase
MDRLFEIAIFVLTYVESCDRFLTFGRRSKRAKVSAAACNKTRVFCRGLQCDDWKNAGSRKNFCESRRRLAIGQ